MTNCIFSGNQSMGSTSAGGGIQSSGAGSATITNSLFIGNTARNGAGIFSTFPDSPTLTNCTFAANSASNNGGGMFLETSSATLDNCVFWDNSDSGGMDESAQIFLYGGTPTVTYTDIQGLTQALPFCVDPQGDPPCAGNIGANPAFVGGASGTWSVDGTFDAATGQTTFTDDPPAWTGDLPGNFLNPDTAQALQSLIVSNTATTIIVWGDFADLGVVGKTYQINDYRLDSPNSPAIDAADNNAVIICSTDLDGNQRFFDDPATDDTGNGVEAPFVDMGAYEFGSPLPPDCNTNGIADECDIFDCLGDPDCGDCNENDIPDECDIAGGGSLDLNLNGIPDECDIDCDDCPTDNNGDGITGPPDLAALLACWGTFAHNSKCVCLDANDDENIGPVDLATLLANWGPCL